MRWTRRPTVLNEDLIPDDWIIRLNGHDVGRVSFAIYLPAPKRWDWASWTLPCRIRAAETLDAALEDLRACVLESTGMLPDKTRLW